eukprot:3405443-Amphidinium_carterae.1
MKAASERLGLGIKLYGPETHITAIIPMALGVIEPLPEADLTASAPPPTRALMSVKGNKAPTPQKAPPAGHVQTIVTATPETTAIVY